MHGRLIAAPSRAYELGAAQGTSSIRQNLDPAAYARGSARRCSPHCAADRRRRRRPSAALASAGSRRVQAPRLCLSMVRALRLISGLYVWFQLSAPGGPRRPEPLNFSVHALPDPRDSAVRARGGSRCSSSWPCARRRWWRPTWPSTCSLTRFGLRQLMDPCRPWTCHPPALA